MLFFIYLDIVSLDLQLDFRPIKKLILMDLLKKDKIINGSLTNCSPYIFKELFIYLFFQLKINKEKAVGRARFRPAEVFLQFLPHQKFLLSIRKNLFLIEIFSGHK